MSYRYDAFLSHSSLDAVAARRIHRILETYRPPRDIRKTRLRVYHYEHDQRTGPDISDELTDGLRCSRNMVLLASKSSAEADYVNLEIHTFLNTLNRKGCDIAVASLDESLPPALGDHLPNPIGADVQGADSSIWLWPFRRLRIRRNLIKLIAQILGEELDRLVRRERRRFHVRCGIGVLTIATLIVGIMWLREPIPITPDRMNARVTYSGDDTEVPIPDELMRIGRLAIAIGHDPSERSPNIEPWDWTDEFRMESRELILESTSAEVTLGFTPVDPVVGNNYWVEVLYDIEGRLGSFSDAEYWIGARVEAGVRTIGRLGQAAFAHSEREYLVDMLEEKPIAFRTVRSDR